MLEDLLFKRLTIGFLFYQSAHGILNLQVHLLLLLMKGLSEDSILFKSYVTRSHV
jgi:hypothetical protein